MLTMQDADTLEFAYRYPFSAEAKDIVKHSGAKTIDPACLQGAKVRVESALRGEALDYTSTTYDKVKYDYINGYAYARMLVSALKSGEYIRKYTAAEAARSRAALESDTKANVMRLSTEMGVAVSTIDKDFGVRFTDFLKFAPRTPGFELSSQRFGNGIVALDSHGLTKVLEGRIAAEIAKGLPIDQKMIPREVLQCATMVSRPQRKVVAMPVHGGTSWIDSLVATPIPDCRHRTVNLILAPYFVNVKQMSVDDATKVISEYIDLCKTVNPNTNITERYIRYQCQYAKTHNAKPMSLRRARADLFSSFDDELFADLEEKSQSKVVEK